VQVAPRRDPGLTLSEVLVVVTVLALLVSLVAVTVEGLRSAADRNACATERRTLEQAVVLWSEVSSSPPSAERLVEAGVLRRSSVHFTVEASGTVQPRPGGPCDTRPVVMAAPAGPAAGTSAGSLDLGTVDAGGASDSGSVAGVADVTDVGGVGGVGGSVEVALTWDGTADLDLWVERPDGAVVGWSAPGVGAGGLDLDVVPATPDAVGPHVERVRWPAGVAPPGGYVAWARVRSLGWSGPGESSYTLTVRRGDRVLAMVTGTIGEVDTVTAPVRVDLSA
jgi:prepilin-type N-terminal cleavage/methylation domain-containing protein